MKTGERSAVPAATGMLKGRVAEILDSGEILVAFEGAGPSRMLCDLLHTSDRPALRLAVDDPVLVWPAAGVDDKGCVMGRIGPYLAPNLDEVVVEANERLVLKCGEGSITLRHDGKVLTKAEDVVSHARRLNRIKGGSVQIN
jgi:hypothetical protein